MAVKKIVISPDNNKAIAFFEELDRKKSDTFKKIDSLVKSKFPPAKK
ncbi:hypothetical protein [Mucilaginibacter pedocola]|nr:hypothetical protein [Mucilaginibacter pedocola]